MDNRISITVPTSTPCPGSLFGRAYKDKLETATRERNYLSPGGGGEGGHIIISYSRVHALRAVLSFRKRNIEPAANLREPATEIDLTLMRARRLELDLTVGKAGANIGEKMIGDAIGKEALKSGIIPPSPKYSRMYRDRGREGSPSEFLRQCENHRFTPPPPTPSRRSAKRKTAKL